MTDRKINIPKSLGGIDGEVALASTMLNGWADNITIKERLKALIETIRTGTLAIAGDEELERLLKLKEEQRLEVFVNFVNQLIEKESSEKADIREINLKKEIDTIHSEELAKKDKELLKVQAQMKRLRSHRLSFNTTFLLLLVFSIAFCSFVIFKGWAQQPEISIQYNVGEIIAGILGGGGVAIAGTAYAVSKFRDRDQKG